MQQRCGCLIQTAFFNAEAVEGGTGTLRIFVEFGNDRIFNSPLQQAPGLRHGAFAELVVAWANVYCYGPNYYGHNLCSTIYGTIYGPHFKLLPSTL